MWFGSVRYADPAVSAPVRMAYHARYDGTTIKTATMRTQSRDTSIAAERVQIALLRQAPIWRKLALANGLRCTLQYLALAGARRRFPHASNLELRRQLAVPLLGAERACALNHAAGEEDMPMATDAIEVTLLVTGQLDALGVAYALGGSLASSAYGFFRATNDADILADLNERQAIALAQALQDSFYVDRDAVRTAVRQRRSFNLIHLQSMFTVDVFVAGARAFDRNQLSRRISQVVATDPERRLYVASPEDTILAKLDWYRQGGELSDHQWTDILGMLKVQESDIDHAYLRQWAPSLGVADLLDRACHDAGVADSQRGAC